MAEGKDSSFQFLQQIGEGGSGKVYLGCHKLTGQYYAIKIVEKRKISPKGVRQIMAERNVLIENVQHPFLVGMHYSFQTSSKLYFVLDYVNGGELFFHLKNGAFGEAKTRFYAAEITLALKYLHSRNVVYRDLKTENILLSASGHIMLTDFGLCKENLKFGETTTTFCGTKEYMAPEVVSHQKYGWAVDWWCLGIVIFEMILGYHPFYDPAGSQYTYENILHKPVTLPPHITTASARDLLEGLLQKDPNHRLGSIDAREIINHNFFHSVKWDDVYHKRVNPPFKPKVSGDLDLGQFDPKLTREFTPKPVSLSDDTLDDTFVGFSFIPPD